MLFCAQGRTGAVRAQVNKNIFLPEKERIFQRAWCLHQGKKQQYLLIFTLTFRK
jgi:hypothetical protein